MRRPWCKCRPAHVTCESRWPMLSHGEQPLHPHFEDRRPFATVTEDTTWMYRNGDLWMCPFCERIWVLDCFTEAIPGIEDLFSNKFATSHDWRRETRQERKKRQRGAPS